jgi:hypothetical protein
MFDAEFINDLKQSLGALSDNLREPGKRFFLLKRGQHSGAPPQVLAELTASFTVSYVKDTFRNTILFMSFSTDEAFPDIFAQATLCAWGTPDADGEINLYAFDPDQKDAADADGLSPLWRAVAFRVKNERFLTG